MTILAYLGMDDESQYCGRGESRRQLCYDFVAWDYVIFALLFVGSAAIGIYFAIKSRNKKDNSDDYLLGGRQMSALPVSLSLTASFISAITVMGTPAEFYIYGTMFWYYAVAYLMVAIIVSEIYIPVFYRLGITSIYEYLEIRFNRHVRVLATTVYILNTVIYVGICIYAPALALNEVTGLGIWWSVTVTALVCTFYTTLGGLKAVIWTDVFQCLVMWIGFVAVLVKGSIDLGGFSNIWDIADKGGRIKFDNFQFDPTIRHTFWSVSIGGTFLWTGMYATTQSMVQRYLSCKSENHARGAAFLNVIGLYIVLVLVGLAGLTMYAYYAGCDPYSKGWVGATDQLMPYFVLELLHDYPGLPGMYVCAAFGGTLSTVSTAISAMSAVTVEDYIKPLKKLTPRKSVVISKILVVVYGIICMLMAVLASQLGGVLQAALSINGLVGGAMVGLFTLGMIFPWCNSAGAFIGMICGLGSALWVYIGSTIYPPPPEKVEKLILCTDTCNATADQSCGFDGNGVIVPETTTTAYATTMEMTTSTPPVAALYSLSYCYYPVFGFCVTIVIGMITSFLTGYQLPSEVNPGTIRPVFDHPVFSWLPKKVRRFLWCGVRHDDIRNESDKVGYLDRGDSVSPYDMQNVGSYIHHGEYQTSIENEIIEKQPSGQNFSSEIKRSRNSEFGGKINYTLNLDEESTSL